MSDGASGRTTSEEGYTVQGGRNSGRGVTLYAKGEAVAVNYSSSTGSRSVYLGKDVLGSVRTTTAETGRLEDRYEYDAFGQPYLGDLSGGMNLGYTGKPYNTATGLYNYGYRDYKPTAARFTTVDPIRDGRNWYAYVNNDPVNFVDLWGFQACSANDSSQPNPQVPFDPNDNHCDINAWNNALNNGTDPRSQTGENWDGNTLSVSDVFNLYPNGQYSVPPPDTSGYAFTPAVEPTHMIFYQRSDGDTYTAHQSDGIQPTTPQTWSIYGNFVNDAIFVPLPPLGGN